MPIKTSGVILGYVMLLVLVCPDIPTPIYLCKEKGLTHPAVVAPPVLGAPIAPLNMPQWLALLHEEARQPGAKVLSLTCQLLC